jgi:adenine-specific DNA-methyltransferase
VHRPLELANLKGRQITGSGAVGTKEYIVCYARNVAAAQAFRGTIDRLKVLMPTVYKGFNYTVEEDEIGPFVLKNELYNTNSVFNEITRPNLVFDIYFNPETGEVRTAPVGDDHRHAEFVKISPKRNNNGSERYHAFRWSAKKVVDECFNLQFVESPSGWKIFTKVRDVDSTALKDLFMDISTTSGSSDIKRVGLNPKWFDYPKPVDLIRLLCEVATEPDSIVLDFFAGSCSTAHAVLEQNAADDGQRRFIMVQIDESLDPKSEASAAGLENIADLGRERLRRAAAALTQDTAAKRRDLDVGFRSLVVDTTNSTDLLRSPDTIDQNELQLQTENLKPDRTGDDLLYQVLLAWGLELTMHCIIEQFDGQEVHVVDENALICCFENGVSREVLRKVASRQPLRAVFRDSAFATDADRINAEQMFAELSPTTDVKVI